MTDPITSAAEAAYTTRAKTFTMPARMGMAPVPFAELPPAQQDNWRSVVRAVLESMKEPTEAMLDAAWEATRAATPAERMVCELASPKAAFVRKMRQRHAAMLGAILSEEKGGE